MATGYASGQGLVTDVMTSYYAHLTLTGPSMVVVEGALVAQGGQGWPHQLSVYSHEHLEGLTRLAETIRDRGGIPFIQLHHGGRRSLGCRQEPLVGPSDIACPGLNRPVRPLTTDEIRLLIVRFADAARLAVRAGFAGVELHGAHGYLIHQFVTPLVNNRDDEYGIHEGKSNRFPLELVRSIRLAEPNLLLGYRISARDYLPQGLTLNETAPFVQDLETAGVDLISVSGGMHASLYGPDSIWGSKASDAVFRSDARRLKDGLQKTPVGIAGKIQTPSLAISILENRDADMIGLGRPLLRDPDWLRKAQGDTPTAIRPCLYCVRCQYHRKGCPDDTSKPTWLT